MTCPYCHSTVLRAIGPQVLCWPNGHDVHRAQPVTVEVTRERRGNGTAGKRKGGRAAARNPLTRVAV